MTPVALRNSLFGATAEIRRFNYGFIPFACALVVFATVGGAWLKFRRVPFLRPVPR